jgi:hypothetical protein
MWVATEKPRGCSKHPGERQSRRSSGATDCKGIISPRTSAVQTPTTRMTATARTRTGGMAVFHDRLAALGFGSYADYLAADHWKDFKRQYRESGRPRTCAVCGGGPVQLHHHDYSRLGSEAVTDVTPLCRDHHVAVHGWLKANGKMVNATHKAVAALKDGAVVRPRMTAAEGKALGLSKRDAKRQKKDKKKRKPPPAVLSKKAAAKEAARLAFEPHRVQLESLLRRSAIRAGQYDAAVATLNVELAEKFIAQGRKRLRRLADPAPKQEKWYSFKSKRRATTPFQPNARAEPDRDSRRWLQYVRQLKGAAKKEESTVPV